MATVYENASLAYGTETNTRLLELLVEPMSPDYVHFVIRCKFHVCSLASQPIYTAISYMWGQDTETSDILLDGKSFAVRVNLYELLKALSPANPGFLWVDALCIDQNSVDERNHQVSLMGKIYSQAKDVLVWLGSDQEEVIGAMKTLKSPVELNLALLTRLLHIPGTTGSGRKQRADQISILCAHPYWTRAWIVQELVLASNVRIRCGNTELVIEVLAIQLQHLRNGLKRLLGHVPKVVTDILNSPAAKLINKRKKWQESCGRSYINPWDTGLGILGCSDVRDRVYAMVALMDPKLAVVPDYNKTPSEIFKEVFEQHLERNGAFFGVIWNLQPMLELGDDEPIVQRARKYGTLEWNPFWGVSR